MYGEGQRTLEAIRKAAWKPSAIKLPKIYTDKEENLSGITM